MENFERSLENQRRFGRNVEVRATFKRHGPKVESLDATGSSLLSDAGREQVRKESQDMDVKESGIKSYTSPVARAIETADIIMDEQRKKGVKTFKQRQRAELALFSGSKEFFGTVVERVKQYLPKNYDQLEKEEKQKALEQAEDIILNWYLEFGDQRPDEETSSPIELAANIAKLVHRYIRMPEKLYSDSKIDLVNVSHKGTLEPFLKETLIREIEDENGEKKLVRGFDRLEEIGGGMRPFEGWALCVKTDENGGKAVKVELRGQQYDIDLDRIEELVRDVRNTK